MLLATVLTGELHVGSDEAIEFEAGGERIQAVHMLPGYTHNITNLSDTEDLVTVVQANEVSIPEKQDTIFERLGSIPWMLSLSIEVGAYIAHIFRCH